MAVGAVGGLAGGLAAARIRAAFGAPAVASSAVVAMAAAALALGVTADVAVAAAALALSSFAFTLWNVVAATERQAATPPALLGRVTSAYRTLLLGAAPLGALAGGLAADGLGLRTPLLLGVPVLLLAAVLGWYGMREPRAGTRRGSA